MLIIARDGHMKVLFLIDSESQNVWLTCAQYQKVAINSKTSMTMPVTEWTSDGFKTGMCCYRYTFYTTGPKLQADGATMVLDGVTLHRKQ